MINRFILAVLLLSAALSATPGRADPNSFTAQQRQEIVQIVREALVRDPTILTEAIAAVQAAEETRQNEASSSAIARHRQALERTPGDPIRGNPNGAITIVEFLDMRCGYCKRMYPVMEEFLRRHPDVRIVVKDLPVLGANSVLAAQAMLAAQKQDRYNQLQAALMALTRNLDEATLKSEAERVGIDWERLRRDMDDPSIRARLEANRRLAQDLGIRGTPAMVIGNTLIPGAVSLADLESALATVRQARR